ncbi:MAG: hypothetical protein Q8M24_16875 [Pseudolabrys sp.]|nr:hypothetical protein [Pseudolabrys sp.]MDP2297119.1 hypothetical protein [Pseudolabrys sp.]
MNAGEPSPADLVRQVYGIALPPAVAERLNAAVTRTVNRAAPLLRQQPCEFDGFAGRGPDNNVDR